MPQAMLTMKKELQAWLQACGLVPIAMVLCLAVLWTAGTPPIKNILHNSKYPPILESMK